MNISKMREQAFKLIYQLEIQKEFNEEILEDFIQDNEMKEKDERQYIRKVVRGVKEKETELEEIIKGKLKPEWPFERISKVDIALLKLAIFEMKYREVPYKVEINEVVELAKQYSEENSYVFINGVLASVVKENL